MIKCTDWTRFDGRLKEGQIWVKGNREKRIVSFDDTYMKYQTKKDINDNSVTKVYRSVFRDWVHSGAMLKVE
jgi:hypothetical protein